jgi:hypothetical protein
VGPLPGDFLFFRKSLRRELGGPVGICSPRGVPPALGEDAFASRSASRGLR